MGMVPKTPNAELLAILDLAEEEIQEYQTKQLKEKERVIKNIYKLKRLLPWLSTNEENILTMAIGTGLYWGENIPVSGHERHNRFNQTGNTKKNRKPGQNGPGRSPSGLIKKLSELITKPSPYSEEQCLKDIIKHYQHIKEFIRRPKHGDSKIYYHNGEPINLRSVKDQLVKKLKKSKLPSKHPTTE